MNILAIETATENCSVAIATGDDHFSLSELAPQKHAQRLLPMIEQLLAEAGLSQTRLDGIAFGRGPGSFTGLRIAAAATQGIALGLELPVIGVSTLAAIAHQRYRAEQAEQTLACLDARMNEVYWGFYESSAVGSSIALQDERVGSIDELLENIEASGSITCDIAGNAAVIVRDYLQQQPQRDTTAKLKLCDPIQPDALDILFIAQALFANGHAVSAEHALPVYLRDRVALTEKEREQEREKNKGV